MLVCRFGTSLTCVIVTAPPPQLSEAVTEPVFGAGTSLGALLLPVGALGAWQYYKNGHLDVRASLLIALGIFIGAYVGAIMMQQLNPMMAKRVFAIFLIVVSVRIWVTA